VSLTVEMEERGIPFADAGNVEGKEEKTPKCRVRLVATASFPVFLRTESRIPGSN
jgi:hypothetical protein